MFTWYAITFLIYFVISLNSEMEREKKKVKTFDTRPQEIEPGPIDSESDVSTTLPSRRLK